jgi:uncharacterized protein (TIGR02246 family)
MVSRMEMHVCERRGDRMTYRRGCVFALLFMFTSMVLGSCSPGNQQTSQPATPADTRAEDEAKIRALDADWVKAVAAKDAQRCASFYADNGSLLLAGAPIATGKDAILKAWTGMLATPGVSLSFSPTKIEVSRAGDLAYDLGDYEETAKDKKGKSQTVKAKYIVVWGKQADGAWKALLDSPTTTTP